MLRRASHAQVETIEGLWERGQRALPDTRSHYISHESVMTCDIWLLRNLKFLSPGNGISQSQARRLLSYAHPASSLPPCPGIYRPSFNPTFRGSAGRTLALPRLPKSGSNPTRPQEITPDTGGASFSSEQKKFCRISESRGPQIDLYYLRTIGIPNRDYEKSCLLTRRFQNR